ncbi:uncharacterized protein [Bemisia tabaci]|uniref:uncharacterized protein isoform X2 n=1 Tax=Bemisia tabaci TaxID=7038 RepID=UPI003B2813AD
MQVLLFMCNEGISKLIPSGITQDGELDSQPREAAPTEVILLNGTSTELTADRESPNLVNRLETRGRSCFGSKKSKGNDEKSGKTPKRKVTRAPDGYLFDDEKAMLQFCGCCCCAHWLNLLPHKVKPGKGYVQK